MGDLRSAVRAYLGAHNMLSGSAPVVVAVSGGPDSLCLLHILHVLTPELGITLHVAHLDHQIRGAESAAEARFVAQIAHDWGLPATIEASDVPAQATQQRANLHAAGRTARYAFLARVARDTAAQAVAVAHHAGDQAETVLLHLLRGAGPEGLSGMRPATPWQAWAGAASAPAGRPPALIRPLLGVERAAIEAYCATQQLAPRHDASNFDLAATRNRIRHELLPLLIEYNPHIVAALGRTATVSASEHEMIQGALDTFWPALATIRAGGVDIAGAGWHTLPPALQRAALRRAYTLLAPADTLEFGHIEQARALTTRGVGRQLDLPGGITLRVGYAGFTLGEPQAPDGPQLALASSILPAHGTIPLSHGWALAITRGTFARTPADAWTLQLDAAQVPGQLVLRRRVPGDRLQLTAGGSRRVQDIFTDAKVPRELRGAWPLVALGPTIIWVAGIRAASAYRAGPNTEHAITLTIVRA